MELSRLGFLLFMSAGLLFSACKRDMFDAKVYNQILSEASTFSEIDPQHTWNLTESHATKVTVNADEAGDENRLLILSGNPFVEDDHAEILAETVCAKGQTVTLFYYAATCLHQFYAAVQTADGRWLLKPFATGQQSVDFANDVTTVSGTPKEVYQTYTYCYEDTYPEPGDYDYNDLVLRIQKLPAQADNEIRLRVSLAAIGTLRQVAAAIRLTGYHYDDVESVTTEEGRVFDPNYELSRYFIEESDLLIKGIHGEAVLNLFEDAHYAMYPAVNTWTDGTVGVVRRYYNTSQVSDGLTHRQAKPKVLTYVVKLRNPRLLQNFTLEDIDPFVLKDYNSGKWEIHTFTHKAYQTLHDLGSNETAYSNNMSWALKIPNGTFRYPQEGACIGYYKDGVLTGAYMTLGHSFGQWVGSRLQSTDWYLYPSTGMVY
jgi:LruC domain-containing protein